MVMDIGFPGAHPWLSARTRGSGICSHGNTGRVRVVSQTQRQVVEEEVSTASHKSRSLTTVKKHS